MSSKPTRIAQLLAFWCTFLLIFSWLPLLRCVFDGESYRWGTAHFGVGFSASGLGPDLWLLVLKTAVLVYLLHGLVRGSDTIHRAVLVLWNLTWAVDAVLTYLRNPNGLVFHGDTLGIHLNLGLLPPVAASLFTLLSFVWAVRDARAPATPKPAWSQRSRRLLTALALMLPVQFLLLRFGAPHGTTDAVGVLLTIAQCPLLWLALAPGKEPGAPQPTVAGPDADVAAAL